MSTTVQNAQLRQALEQWLQASLPFLSSYLSGKNAGFAKWLIANAMNSSDSPFYALPETQALLSLAQTTPEFWAVDPSVPPSAVGGIYSPDELIRDVIAGFTYRYFLGHP